MATSDPRDFFNNRLTQELERNAQFGISTRYDDLQEASTRKIAELKAYRQERLKIEQAQRDSLVGRLGMDPDGLVGGTVNTLVATGNELSNAAGAAISGFNEAQAAALDQHIPDEVNAAHARRKQGVATAEDEALLALPAGYTKMPEYVAPMYRQNFKDGTYETNGQRIEARDKAKGSAQGIRNAFDLTNQVAYDSETDQRASGLGRRLVADPAVALAKGVVGLGDAAVGVADLASFGAAGKALDDIGRDSKRTQAFLDSLYSPEQQLANKKVGDTEGFLRTLEAGLKNPSVIATGLIESLPSMLAGGAVGKAALAAFPRVAALVQSSPVLSGVVARATPSAGVAGAIGEGTLMAGSQAEAIRQQTEDGRLSLKQALLAAGTGVMGAGVGVLGNKVAGKLGVGDIDEAVVKGALSKSPNSVLTSTVLGGAIEGGEELLQSTGETVAKNLALDKEYDQGVGNAAAMGLLTGTPLGAVGGMGERIKQEAQATATRKSTDQMITAAIETGDLKDFTDPKKPSYSIDNAIAVLSARSSKPDATEADKQANLEKAGELLSGLEDKRDNAKSLLNLLSLDGLKANLAQYEAMPQSEARDAEIAAIQQDIASWDAKKDRSKDVKPLEKELAALDAQIAASKATLQEFNQEAQAKDLDVATEVAAINGSDTAASTASARRVINLAMATPERLDAAVATELAGNEKNALTVPQRAYLRAFSAARLAANELKDLGKVRNDIMAGGEGFVGIAAYRADITAQVAAGNQKGAEKTLAQLDKFVGDHEAKAKVVGKAFADFKLDGKARQVRSDGNRGWRVEFKTLTDKQRAEEAAVFVEGYTSKIARALPLEAEALKTAQAELRAAIDMKFSTPKSEVNNVKDVSKPLSRSQGAESVSETAPKAEASAAQDSGGTGDAPAKSDVQRSENTGVSQEAPASTAKTVEDATTQGQLQSTEKTSTAKVADKDLAESIDTTVVEASTDAATDVVEPGSLLALQNKSPEGTTYQSRNLLADHTTQSAGRATDSTKRPLVAVKNFMSQVASGVSSFADFLVTKAEDLTDEQSTHLSTFAEFATAMAPVIQKDLVKGSRRGDDAKFYFRNPVQFLIQKAEDGKLSVEENVSTSLAYAGWNAVTSMGHRPFNSAAEINGLLRRSEDSALPPLAIELFGEAGEQQNALRNSWGQDAVSALGLKALKNAPMDLIPRLEASLGIVIEKMLLKAGIIERVVVNSAQLQQLKNVLQAIDGPKAMEGFKIEKNTQLTFLRIKRNADGSPVSRAKRIIDSTRGTFGILEELFGTEASASFPSLEALPYTQKQTKTGAGIPSELRATMEKKHQEENRINDAMWHVYSDLNEEVALAIAGKEEVDTQTTHSTVIAKARAINDGLQREYNNLMDFVQKKLSVAGEDNLLPFFFQFDVWSVQRVGIANNAVNPNASKLHRAMMYQPDWAKTITRSNVDEMNSFKLRVLEGFGVKTERDMTAASLAKFDQKIDPEFAISEQGKLEAGKTQAAIEILRKRLFDGATMSAADQDTLKEAVAIGGEKMHTLLVLVSLAEMKQAEATGTDTFETRIYVEIDGVTNGVILTHAMYGAAETPAEMNGMMNQGGIFNEANDVTQYNHWKSQPGHKDLYETNTSDILKHVQAKLATDQFAWTAPINAAASAFVGVLSKAGDITSKGRNFIKGPTTEMIFGSGINTSIGNMFAGFLEKVYATIGDVAKGEGDMTREELIKQLNVMLKAGKDKNGPAIPLIPANTSIEDLLKKDFSEDLVQFKALSKSFMTAFGYSVKDVIQTNFAPFLNTRKGFVEASNLAFEIYAAAYKEAKTTLINQLMEAEAKAPGTGIAFRTLKDGTKDPLHDLSYEQDADLRKQLAAIEPRLHTTMSQATGELGAGLRMWNKATTTAGDYSYEVMGQFASAFDGTEAYGSNSAGRQPTMEGPSVSMLPVKTHSTDSAITHRTQKEFNLLNGHDAIILGLTNAVAAAKYMNENTWKAVLETSPMSDMFDSMTRTMLGITGMINEGKATPAMLEKIRGLLAETASGSVTEYMSAMKKAAAQADRTKFDAMSTWTSVDQYAFEGGAYEVTAADRADAAKRSAGVSAELSAKQMEIFTALDEALGKIESQPNPDAFDLYGDAPVLTAFGPVGESTIKSDPELVSFFKANPKTGVAEVIKMLGAEGRLNGVNKKILHLVSRTLRAANPDLTVRFVTPETDPASLLAPPAERARGWYVATVDGKTEIYVLSPEFTASGLTTELLLHEMVHAAVAHLIDNPTEQSKPLIAELESLMKAAMDVAQASGSNEFAAAFANLDEFVAWGMTNQAFQDQILKRTQFKSATTGNALVDGMKAFIGALTKMLMGQKSSEISNGLEALVSNVSGLFAEAGQMATPRSAKNLAMASTEEIIDAYDTLEIHAALDNGAVDSAFQDHLANLLSGIVKSLHGPFGALAAQMRKTEAGTPEAAYVKGLLTGKMPFASQVLANLAVSPQEAFAIEQIEATVKAALSDNEAFTKVTYRELSDLYEQVERVVKPSDFASQAEYDFVFEVKASNGDRSDYLARFAALALGSQQFNTLLAKASERRIKGAQSGETFLETVQRIFGNILAWASFQLTKTNDGQLINEKIETLVSQLVDIEAKKRETLKAAANKVNYLAPVEDKIKELSEVGRKKIADIAASGVIQDNASSFVSASGALVRIVANDQVDWLMKGLSDFRDSEFKGRLGVIAGLANSVKGPKDYLMDLVLAVKDREKHRQEIIMSRAKMALEVFSPEMSWTDEGKAAVTKTFMRTGAHNLLANYSLAQLDSLLNQDAVLDKEIASLIQQLDPKMRNAYVTQANALGYYKATGRNRAKILMLNAHLISRMANTTMTNQITKEQALQAEPVIKTLVSLYALRYTQPEAVKAAQQVLRTENNRKDGGNGVEFVLLMHQRMEQESLAKLFKGNTAQMEHGYLPEIVNPNTEFEVATAEEGKTLQSRGYELGAEVSQDAADPDQEGKRLYVLKDGGKAQWLSGAFSLKSNKAKGSSHYAGIGIVTQNNRAEILNAKLTEMKMDKQDPSRDLSMDKSNHLAPTFDDKGNITDWRYLMAHDTKDALLERNNSFDKIIGVLAGSVYDKETTLENNSKVITAAREQYTKEYAHRKQYYVEVGANSTDPEMRELWDMLPYETKEEVRKVWGRDGMKVHNEALDTFFGYRKLSASNFLRKNPQALEGVAKVLRGWFTTYAKTRGMDDAQADDFAARMGLHLLRGERGMQEIVREIKDIIVIRTLNVMVDNILSNFTFLWTKGVPLKDMVHHHLVAWNGAYSYRKDHARIGELQTQLDTGYTQGKDSEIRREMAKLKDRMARNPVTPLIESGLMPTIVEDVSENDDPFSYKSALTKKTDAFTSKLNPVVREVGKQIYMTPKTKIHQGLSYVTQMSDFMARYTMYQHETNKAKDPMSHQDAVRTASESFVNYDLPMHRTVQYLDDMGIVPFIKYFINIQRVLVKLTRDNPARVFMLASLNGILDLGPIVLDGSALARVGNNPFDWGALKYFNTLDNLATVKGTLSLFK